MYNQAASGLDDRKNLNHLAKIVREALHKFGVFSYEKYLSEIHR